jgi:hypothetical protein
VAVAIWIAAAAVIVAGLFIILLWDLASGVAWVAVGFVFGLVARRLWKRPGRFSDAMAP